jgi:hypothetical protein
MGCQKFSKVSEKSWNENEETMSNTSDQSQAKRCVLKHMSLMNFSCPRTGTSNGTCTMYKHQLIHHVYANSGRSAGYRIGLAAR